MSEEERALFQLAEMLHTPVTRLRDEMSASEFMGWFTFFQDKADRESGNLLAGNTDDLVGALTK